MKKSFFVFLLMCSILFTSNTTYTAGKFIHTNGTQIVDKDGNDIYFNGINLGNWLVWEGYLMMGDFQYRTHTQFLNSTAVAFGNDMAKAKEFEHQWRMNYVTEKAITDLKNLGFNSVRLPFHYNLFWDGSKVKDEGFQYIDSLVSYCKKNGIYILLDMHAAPGYQNPGDHCDNVNSNASHPRETVKFWDGNNVEIAATVWKYIATRYKDEPTIWGYDLINEPVPQVKDEWKLLKSMKTMRDSIREVDNNHIIVAEGAWWASWMNPLDWRDNSTQTNSGIYSKWDNNIVYETHHYSTDISQLDDRLALCNALQVPMILGEYGESDTTNIRAITDWCINNNVDYFPWSFKKMSHDKCLWTVEPNDAYESLKTAISLDTVGPASLYDDMIKFCKNNISNGADGLVWHQSFYNAVKDPYSNKQHPYNGVIATIPGVVEAENYDEGCNAFNDLSAGNTGGEYRTGDVDITDANGNGFAIGWIENNEWLEYTVNIASEANYDIDYIVATEKSGEIKLIIDDSVKTTMPVSTTGGWAKYDTLTVKNIRFPAGKQVLKTQFSGEFNFDKLIFRRSDEFTATKVSEIKPELISVYPNPVKNILKITTKRKGDILIYNINGKILNVAKTQHLAYSHGSPIKIDVSAYNKGIYFVIIKKGEKVEAIKSFYILD